MEALLPIFRLLHYLGFSLLLGGIIASIVLLKSEGASAASIRQAHTSIHMIAAPGLVMLILTGILHSSILRWSNFTGAGYMHAKILFVVVIFMLMIIDLRTQKKIKTNTNGNEHILRLVKKRQAVAITMGAITICVMWLVMFKPF